MLLVHIYGEYLYIYMLLVHIYRVTLKLGSPITLSTHSAIWFKKSMSSLMTLGTNLHKGFKVISRKSLNLWMMEAIPATIERNL